MAAPSAAPADDASGAALGHHPPPRE